MLVFLEENDIYDNEDIVGLFYTYKDDYTLESVKETLCDLDLVFDSALFVG